MTGNSDHILTLVRTALDEFESAPLGSSVRRAVRIAALLGESEVGAYLSLELKPMAGDPKTNSKVTRNAMSMVAAGRTNEAMETALRIYSTIRSVPGEPVDDRDGKMVGTNLEGLEYKVQELTRECDEHLSPDLYAAVHHYREVVSWVRQYVSSYLCRWETQLTFSTMNERIFSRFQRSVDSLLEATSSGLVEQFSAV